MSKNPQLATSKGHIAVYAGQAMNIKDMMLSDLRDRLKGDKSASYTYSADFQSQVREAS